MMQPIYHQISSVSHSGISEKMFTVGAVVEKGHICCDTTTLILEENSTTDWQLVALQDNGAGPTLNSMTYPWWWQAGHSMSERWRVGSVSRSFVSPGCSLKAFIRSATSRNNLYDGNRIDLCSLNAYAPNIWRRRLTWRPLTNHACTHIPPFQVLLWHFPYSCNSGTDREEPWRYYRTEMILVSVWF